MESELKFRISPSELDAIIFSLKRDGYTPKKSKKQTDDYYIITKGRYYLRIRHLEGDSGSLDSHKCLSESLTEETELYIPNRQKMSKILEDMGMKKICTFDKTRTVYENQTDLSVCVDTIQNLGVFIELEILSTQDETARLRAYAQKLGLSQASEIRGSGYPDLMIQNR